MYLEDLHALAAYAPAYHAVCLWLQTIGCAWFQQVTGWSGTVSVSASWYRPGDYSTPHNDRGRRRHIAFVWHVCNADAEWDERCGGDFVWCEPYLRFRPSSNSLYLFRVHESSMHFVQNVWCETVDHMAPTEPQAPEAKPEGVQQSAPPAQPKRLAVNGWFVLDEAQPADKEPRSLPNAGATSVGSLEERLNDEGFARHRENLARLMLGHETSFVYHA